ncbi:MAG TPA: MoxR family ATPase [Microbacteriaceae bacterium]|nr:MoxR family ATPase [Microbacteriaceae bacterium]
MSLRGDTSVSTLGRPAAPWAKDIAARITASVETVIQGKPDAIRTALTVLLSGGHLLIEDVPGVGKTVLVKALARCVGCSVARIQFTPDLLPGDVTGVAVYDQREARFVFKPGPVFADIVIGDEINRASPKTQSALLECMAERQVTVDGATYPLAVPFTVFATQNPIEMEGTYALPEAQRDRFTARIAMGYPGRVAEVAMLGARDGAGPLERLAPVIDVEDLRDVMGLVRRVYVSAPVKQYVVDIVRATRDDPEVRIGASPRATLQLVAVAKAQAVMDGRDFAIPDDVDSLAVDVLAHRLILLDDVRRPDARRAAGEVVGRALRRAAAALPAAPGPLPGALRHGR